jgi:diaminopimelate epimerase
MSIIKFTKTVASGNDFIVIENYSNNLPKLAQKFCQKKYGIGADGLLVLAKSKKANFKMRIFNPDGSEAEMCGNGLRCASLVNGSGKIETKAGILTAEVKGNRVKVKMTQPRGIKLNIPLSVSSRKIKVNFIDTGVPHTVIFVEGLDKIDIKTIGRQVRFHKKFRPKGTNVDFVEIVDRKNIKIRTYERGVEDETLACGTGAVASAIISAFPECSNFSGDSSGCRRIASQKNFIRHSGQKHIINVYTRSGEVLKIYFTLENNKISDVHLEGEAKIVYGGTINV